MVLLAVLDGDLPDLAQAELEALTGTAATQLTDRLVTIPESAEAARAVRADPLSQYVHHFERTEDRDLDAATTACLAHVQPGSFAIRTLRLGRREETPHSTQDLARALGARIHDAGHPVDLRQPDQEFLLVVHGNVIALGVQPVYRPKEEFQHRQVKDRDHFRPITLHPRTMASLVHLTGLPKGSLIYDPCCGTGGILLEAICQGYRAMGSDLDTFMVQGTLQTLTDAQDGPHDALVFQADAGRVEQRVPVHPDAVVSDLPYGKSSTTDMEPVSKLYPRILSSIAKILQPGAVAVLGVMDPTALGNVADHGFKPKHTFQEYVHRSMTRHYVVLERLP